MDHIEEVGDDCAPKLGLQLATQDVGAILTIDLHDQIALPPQSSRQAACARTLPKLWAGTSPGDVEPTPASSTPEQDPVNARVVVHAALLDRGGAF